MRKLEVGDEIVLIQNNRWNGRTYCFETIASVSNMQAKTNKRTVLRREPIGVSEQYKTINAGCKQYWYLFTDEIKIQYQQYKEAQQERSKISTWWSNFRPDSETMSELYYQFHPKE